VCVDPIFYGIGQAFHAVANLRVAEDQLHCLHFRWSEGFGMIGPTCRVRRSVTLSGLFDGWAWCEYLLFAETAFEEVVNIPGGESFSCAGQLFRDLGATLKKALKADEFRNPRGCGCRGLQCVLKQGVVESGAHWAERDGSVKVSVMISRISLTALDGSVVDGCWHDTCSCFDMQRYDHGRLTLAGTGDDLESN